MLIVLPLERWFMMKKRKKLITENTIINVDESILKSKAEELICELFVDYVNNKKEKTVLELVTKWSLNNVK